MNRINELAKRFVERAEALGYKGKERDDAALDFFCGAAVGAEIIGNQAEADRIGRVAVMMVSVRGYIAIKELAAEREGSFSE